jgi:hypothetical protein
MIRVVDKRVDTIPDESRPGRLERLVAKGKVGRIDIKRLGG